jgi:PAS domain S-box-containing protein
VVDEHGRVTRFNSRFAEMWRTPAQLLEARSDQQMIEHAASLLVDPETFKSRITELYGSDEESVDILRFKDGRVLERSSRPLIQDGEVAGRVWTFSDQSEQYRMQDELVRSEAKFRTMYDSSRDALMLAYPGGPFFSGNRATLELFGCASEAEFQSLGPADLSPQRQPDGEESSDKAQRMMRLAHERGSHFFEWQHMRRNGEVFAATVLLTRMRIGGDDMLLATVRDISEQKRIEEELQRYRGQLEDLVAERTAKLLQANAVLRQEITERQRIEEERARLIKILEETSDLVSWSTTGGEIQYMNQAGRRILGWGDDEPMAGRRLIADAHPDWAAQLIVNEGLPAAIEHGIWRGETALLASSGKELPTSQVIMSHRSSDGEVAYLSTIARDISEVKESEAKYRLIADSTTDIIWAMDMDWNLVYVSPSVEKLLGYTPEEYCAMPIEERLTPESAVIARQTLAEAVHDLQAGRIDPSSHIARTEVEYCCKDGSTKWAEVVASWTLDSNEVVIGINGVTRDISESRRTAHELSRLRKLLSNIINSMPSVLIGVDAEGIVNQWNREAEQVTGTTAAAALGRPLQDVYPIYAERMERVHQAICSHQPYRENRVPWSRDDSARFADITIYPLVGSGIEGAVIRMDDVTEQIRIEELMVQSEKMVSVGGLAAGMAHEINNPLAGIMQGAQVIRQRISPDLPKSREVAIRCGTDIETIHGFLAQRGVIAMLDHIMESGIRANRIVQNMLRFSRKSEAQLGLHDLAELLDETVELAANDYDLKKSYDFKQIKIDRRYQPDVPAVTCERTEIQQVFFNLLNNGAHAMAEGLAVNHRQPQLTIGLQQRGDMAEVVIEDNGPGMEDAVRRRVFEPFFTTKDTGTGTGLGLSVSYFIVCENHGGSLTVESAPGRGSRFVVKLPIKGPPTE